MLFHSGKEWVAQDALLGLPQSLSSLDGWISVSKPASSVFLPREIRPNYIFNNQIMVEHQSPFLKSMTSVTSFAPIYVSDSKKEMNTK